MALYHIGLVICIILLYFLFRKVGVPYPLSKILQIILIGCVLATACLGQNYTINKIPGVYDGMAVSNSLAFFIMGDDGWSHEKFDNYFDGFLRATLIVMALYIFALIWEAWRYKRNR